MKNAIKQFGIIAVAAVIGLFLAGALAACSNPAGGAGGDGPPASRTAVYVSEDSAGKRYTLEVTESLQNRAASYAAKKGGSFTLKVEQYSGGTYTVVLTSSGTVNSTAVNGAVINIAITVNGKSLEIVMDGLAISEIKGDTIVDGAGKVVIQPIKDLIPVFTSSATLREWLASKAPNTAATSYTVKLNVSDSDLYETVNYNPMYIDIIVALQKNESKFVTLDFSGSTFTSFPDVTALSGRTNLTAIKISEANTAYSTQDGVLYNKNKTVLLVYPAGKSGASFTIPNSVTGIGDVAFQSCTSLTSVTIPNNVTSIGEFAFGGCTGLTSVTIPASVTSIEAGAFSYCTSLTSVTIPNGVTIALNNSCG